jgi:hypothetical protein
MATYDLVFECDIIIPQQQPSPQIDSIKLKPIASSPVGNMYNNTFVVEEDDIEYYSFIEGFECTYETNISGSKLLLMLSGESICIGNSVIHDEFVLEKKDETTILVTFEEINNDIPDIKNYIISINQTLNEFRIYKVSEDYDSAALIVLREINSFNVYYFRMKKSNDVLKFSESTTNFSIGPSPYIKENFIFKSRTLSHYHPESSYDNNIQQQKSIFLNRSNPIA